MNSLLIAGAQTIIIGLIVFLIERKITRSTDASDSHSEAQKKRDLLQMQMLMANNKLSYAVAMAIKRGQPNGEVEEALEAYEDAKTAYYEFLNQQAVEYLR